MGASDVPPRIPKTIVLSPTIALAMDQVKQLNALTAAHRNNTHNDTHQNNLNAAVFLNEDVASATNYTTTIQSIMYGKEVPHHQSKPR